MTTLGASGWPCRYGVVVPMELAPLLGLLPPMDWCDWDILALFCMFNPLAGAPGIGAPACVWVGPSDAGSGLFRDSTRLEVDEVGVAWAELAGDWFEEPPRGDAVPEEASFFVLASLLPPLLLPALSRSLSFVRESWLWEVWLTRGAGCDTRAQQSGYLPPSDGSLSSCSSTPMEEWPHCGAPLCTDSLPCNAVCLLLLRSPGPERDLRPHQLRGSFT